jgi:hypothetical protein
MTTQSHLYEAGDLLQVTLTDLSKPIMRARWRSDWGCWVTQGPWTPVPGNRTFTLTIEGVASSTAAGVLKPDKKHGYN